MSRAARSRAPAASEVAGPALVADLLSALCEESEALKRGDPAALAAAESRKRHLLRMLTVGSAIARRTSP